MTGIVRLAFFMGAGRFSFCHVGVLVSQELGVRVATHFVQTAPVNAKGEYIAERWVTAATHGSEETANRSAQMMSRIGWVFVRGPASRCRGRGGPVANGVRVISLCELLEAGPQELYDAILDLTNQDGEYLISSHLGFE